MINSRNVVIETVAIEKTIKPPGQSIHEVFFGIAAAMPDRVAIICEARSMTYAELANRASIRALQLHRMGVKRGDRIGLVMPRSPEAIVAMLAILQVGAAYVPFDPAYPLKVLQHLYQDSQPCQMLVNGSTSKMMPEEIFWEGETVDFSLPPTLTRLPGNDHELPVIASSDACYVMYTSGSTGQPKGVQIPHRAVLRLVVDCTFATLDAYQSVLHMAPLAFDASTFEIWGALLNGGRLVILPMARPSLADIADTIQQHKVTTAWLTAGVFHLMVDQRIDGLMPLRQLLAGGDVLSPSHVKKALLTLPQCRLINGYGPTENTTFSCCYTIPHDVDINRPLSIGSAIAGTHLYVMDEALHPVPEGEIGELVVAGLGLADGYLNLPELTRERFVIDPHHTPGDRMYRTGDRVSQRPDGNLDFLGRVDRQIKVNGKRVELDAIEACLRLSTQVADAAVICLKTTTHRMVVAFVTAVDPTSFDLAELRLFLHRELPDYMIPSAIEIRDALPLSASGKVDRALLSLRPSETASTDRTNLAYSSRLELKLLKIWRNVLHNEHVDLDDNFFDVGGSSLQLMQMHAILQAELGCELTLVQMFEVPRIRSLAARMRDPSSATASIIPSHSPTDRAQLRAAALERARPTPRAH